MGLLERKEIIIDGVRIKYYLRTNQISEHILVFLHGWRSEAFVWKKVMENLQGNFSCFAVDLPGFGNSDDPPDGANLDFYAAIINSFVVRLDKRKVILIGHSFGGRIAIKIAAQNPDWLSALVLVNAAGKEDRSLSKKMKWIAAKVIKPFFGFRMMQPIRRRLYMMIGAYDYLATPRLQKTFVSVVREDLSKLLPIINKATLIVWGLKDQDVPLSFAYELRDSIREAEFFPIQNAGHYSFIDEPQAFCLRLETFLKERVLR